MMRTSFILCPLLLSGAALAVEPARIRIVEKGTDWPVPLVSLGTSYSMRYTSDNAGLVAVDDPEAWGQRTWFFVRGYGYGLKPDWLGNAGFAFTPQAGQEQVFEVPRTSIARCMGRLTGGGLFAMSQKLGERADWRENGEMGRVGVQCARFKDKLFWVWEETPTASSPRGIVSAARTAIPMITATRPPIAPRYADLVSVSGGLRGVFLPADWQVKLSGLVALKDAQGVEHLGAVWRRGKEAGLCEWNSAHQSFEVISTVPGERLPVGHAVHYRTPQGRAVVLFGDPFPTVAVRDSYETWKDPAQWKRVAGERWVKPAKGGEQIKAKAGSIAWNAALGRWVAIFTRDDEAKREGRYSEVWFAQAEAPTGPWRHGVKVLDCEGYSFLAPLIHSYGYGKDCNYLLFEGTLTAKESGKRREVRPRGLDCQVLYKLELSDLR